MKASASRLRSRNCWSGLRNGPGNDGERGAECSDNLTDVVFGHGIEERQGEDARGDVVGDGQRVLREGAEVVLLGDVRGEVVG